jgi:ubiquinone/menaquinone biosynthesis C-methylase UbiE
MNINTYNPTERFTDVVDAYVKYRPGYPAEILEILRKTYKIGENTVFADIGSGTGIFSKQFVEAGYLVYGVEPNDGMRAQSENWLIGCPNFKAIKGTAEDTTLPSQSIDMLTAAQSFHWFDIEKALKEFYRILKPEGYTVIVWNDRKSNGNPFMNKYEKLICKYCADYKETSHKKYSFERIKEIFKNQNIDLYMIDNFQDMDFKALIGRLKSCSYCPKPDNKNYNPLMWGLNKLFDSYQAENLVRFEYDTIIYVIQNLK